MGRGHDGHDSDEINLGSAVLDMTAFNAAMKQSGQMLMAFAKNIEQQMQKPVPHVSAMQRTMQGLATGIRGMAQIAGTALAGLSQRFSQTAAQFAQTADRIKQSAAVAAAGVQNLGKAMGALTVAAGGGAVALIKLASDANEAASKFGFVFGKATEDTGKKLDEFAKAAGRSRYAMRDMAANVGALIGPMGFTEQKTGELSTAFSKLAVDLSSFFNVTEDDALMALKSGIVGESEPLRRFGVQLNEAKIQQEAFNLGLAKTKDQVQGAVKTQAILSIVLRETKQAQGDAIRTGDQFANSLRRMKDFAKDAATDLGQSLIPAATKLIRVMGDLAEPVKNWANANREWLTQKVDQAMGIAGDAGSRLVAAFQSGWESATKLAGAFGNLSAKASGFFQQAKAIWSSMPTWAQDTILVGGSLLSVGTGLEFIGARVPFVGGLAVELGKVVNPMTLIKGLVAFLGPALAAVFSPIGAVVAIAAAAIYGLVKSFQAAYDQSEAFRNQWERIKDKLGEIWGSLKSSATEVFDGIGIIISDLTDGAFKSLGDVGMGVAEGLLDGFERLLDWFNGDGKGLQSIGITIAKTWNSAIASILESIADLTTQASQMFYGPVGKLLAKVDPEFAKLYMHYAGANTNTVADTLRGAAAGMRNKNAGLDQQQQEIEAQRSAEKTARDQTIKQNKADKALAKAGAEDADYSASLLGQFGEQLGRDIAKGQTDFDKSNSADVAQANQQVAQAAAGQAGDVGEYNIDLKQQKTSDGQRFGHGFGTAGSNAKLLGKNNQAMLKQAGGMAGAQGDAAQQAAAVITQIGQTVIEAFANSKNLTSEQQGAAIDLEKTYRDLVEQFKAGTLTQQEFQKQVKAAANQANKLAEAEKELTDEEVAALNAKGIFTQKQKEAQQQAMQQFAQQAQQGLQQGMQQIQDMLKQGGQAQQQAAAEMDQQINDALKSGDPQKVKAALDLFKGYAQAQIQQTLQNVANSYGGDPNRASFGSVERQGAGTPINLQQLLVGQPQAASTIKMLQAEIDAIDKLVSNVPKMAAGGIVTGPTNALIGEAGPEAVIPLGQLKNLLGNPSNIFPSGNIFGINPGGGSINPLGLNAANLSAFGAMFNNASALLSRQIDLGNLGAQSMLDQWSKIQQGAENSLSWMYQHRQITLSGNRGGSGMLGGFSQGPGASAAGMSLGNLELHFHGVDISQPGAAQTFAAQLAPALDQHIRSMGKNITGRRAFGYETNGRGALTPAGQAR